MTIQGDLFAQDAPTGVEVHQTFEVTSRGSRRVVISKCGLEFPIKDGIRPPDVSSWWTDVTCPKCIYKPKETHHGQ